MCYKLKYHYNHRGAKYTRNAVKLIDRTYTDNGMAKQKKRHTDKHTNNSTQDTTQKTED